MALAADKAAGVAKEGTPLVAGHEGLAHRRKRVLGLLLAVLSALIASIDPLLTRFVRLNTETDAAVIAWKYLAVGSILIVFVHATSEDTPIGLIRKLHASKAYLHLGRAALLMALHNLLWTMAVLETSIGHAIATHGRFGQGGEPLGYQHHRWHPALNQFDAVVDTPRCTGASICQADNSHLSPCFNLVKGLLRRR